MNKYDTFQNWTWKFCLKTVLMQVTDGGLILVHVYFKLSVSFYSHTESEQCHVKVKVRVQSSLFKPLKHRGEWRLAPLFLNSPVEGGLIIFTLSQINPWGMIYHCSLKGRLGGSQSWFGCRYWVWCNWICLKLLCHIVPNLCFFYGNIQKGEQKLLFINTATPALELNW